jgi:hypothetical protein
MEPPEDRSDETKRHLGELVPSAGGAVGGALAGLLIGGPPGAVVGAATGAVLEHVTREALRRRWERGEQAVEIAAAEANLTPEELLQRILADKRLLELAATVIAAAAETTLDAQIRALGQALARGTLADDDTEIERERFIARRLAALEPLHVRALFVLAGRTPGQLAWGADYVAAEINASPGQAEALLAKLTAEGLARDATEFVPVMGPRGGPRWEISDLGQEVLALLRGDGPS